MPPATVTGSGVGLRPKPVQSSYKGTQLRIKKDELLTDTTWMNLRTTILMKETRQKECIYNMKSRKHKLIYSDKKQLNGYLGLGKVSTERSEGYHQGARQDFWEWRVYLLF